MPTSSQAGRVLAAVAVLVAIVAACSTSDDVQSAEAVTDPPPDRTIASAPAAGWIDPAGTTISFAEVTEAAGVAVSHRSPFDSQKDGAEMMGGAAAGDFDNDGWQDLFVIGGGVNADSLFINQGDGSFVDMAEPAGLADLYVGSGATVADYDGDGWLDIFVTSHGTPEEGQVPGRHHLYRNNGDLTFTDVAEAAGVNMTSRGESDGFGSAFGDYDLDGDLDLFVAGWVRDEQGNRLFRNEGDGTFVDVTEQAGIIDDGIRGFSPCMVDTDGDRYPEILLVADFGTSRYFKNQGDGTFVDYTTASETGLEWSGMGTAIGDFDRNGLVDWYTTAIFDDENSGRGDGNKLYLNQGNHQYVETAADAGVADGGWGWGAVAVDLNLDGLLDLVEVNGWRLPSYDNERAKVWIQTTDMAFVEVADVAGLHHDQFGLSVVHVDIDNDGDQDIAVTSGNDAFRLYENLLDGPRSNWLRVELDTSANPNLAPDGIGATVSVVAGGEPQTWEVAGCSNYLSASDPTAHFGLGSVDVVERVRVEWQDGSSTEVEQVAANQTIEIEAPPA